ncbi:hypothetical protein [Helicobacter cholecystus]|uniref:hypothetical protein n=1 Tax=Helicobacter cholecystus TaxID=45498 RepID=UPI002739C032|nr:hypothetical protein [Helicobacter cholecystus]
MDNTVINPQSKRQKKGVVTFLLGFFSVMILLGALGGVGYYYLMIKGNQIDALPIAQTLKSNMTHDTNVKEMDELIKQIGIKNNQIKVLTEENTALKKQASSMTQRLSYIIKPKTQLVVECYKSKTGKWQLPQECVKTLIENVEMMLKEDKKIVALEVSGVVDEQKYGGSSPELKQEGLASFRAKSVIKYLKKSLQTITVFEGLSVQEKGKRGYFIRAYYVE